MIVKNVFNKLQKKICSPFYDSVPSLSTQQILSLLSDAIPNFSWWKCPNIVVKNNFNQLQKENFSWRCPTIVHHCPILSPLSDAIPNFPGRRSGSPSKARLPRPNPSLMSLQNKQIELPAPPLPLPPPFSLQDKQDHCRDQFPSRNFSTKADSLVFLA